MKRLLFLIVSLQISAFCYGETDSLSAYIADSTFSYYQDSMGFYCKIETVDIMFSDSATASIVRLTDIQETPLVFRCAITFIAGTEKRQITLMNRDYTGWKLYGFKYAFWRVCKFNKLTIE